MSIASLRPKDNTSAPTQLKPVCVGCVLTGERDFEPAIGFTHQILCGNETQALSEEEVEAYLARQRAGAKSRKPDASEDPNP